MKWLPTLAFSIGALGSYGATAADMQAAQIIWAAPTNQWPESLWVYKVVPQEFPASVVSNLLTLASFTMKARTKAPQYLLAEDRSIIYFGNADGASKHLAISPALGYIEYHDPKAQASNQFDSVAGVPDEQQTTELGLKYLRLLGIDRSEIATKPGTCELDLHWERGTIGYVDPKTKNEITLTNSFGVFFCRRIDGISVRGIGLGGGVRISFGNNGKIADLQVCWRNLKPHQLHDCPSPNQIVNWLKSGRMRLHAVSSAGGTPPLPQKIQKLTITKATPLYEGKPEEEPMGFVSPYAVFQALAEDGETRTALWFQCPMTASKVEPPPE